MPLVLFLIQIPLTGQAQAKDPTPVDEDSQGDAATLGDTTISKKASESQATVEPIEQAPVINYRDILLDFIREAQGKGDIEYVAQHEYMNGVRPWVSLSFTCPENQSERLLSELVKIGIGSSADKNQNTTSVCAGIVNVLPISTQRLGSRPKTVGNRTSLTAVKPAPSVADDGTKSSASHSEPRDGASNFLDQDENRFSIRIDLGDDDPTGEAGSEEEDDDQNVVEEIVFALPNNAEINDELHPGGKDDADYFGKDFQDTIKSRVAVDTLLEIVEDGVKFTFDYVMLIIIAAVIAAVGLMSNSVVSVVASMLVSPLMGPILGVTFGITVWDTNLIKRGLQAELAGIFLCFAVGFVSGLVAIPFIGSELPTDEMKSRATTSALITGVFIAIPSGFGVALSILGKNSSSLVGVAISASLLPPAVNTGILTAMSCFSGTKYIDWKPDDPNYSEQVAGALLVSGVCSLGLTLLNIICIWISGVTMFKIKEVRKGGDDFWGHDVPLARDFNRKLDNAEPEVQERYQQAFYSAKKKEQIRHLKDALISSATNLKNLKGNKGRRRRKRNKKKKK